MTAQTLIGADTSLLVAHSLADHPDREAASGMIKAELDRGSLFGLCPVVLDEFIHVVTDPRRFERALKMPEAIHLARTWSQSRETILLHSSDQSLRLQMDWLERHRLGRKRIHDTQIAAIYHLAGIKTLFSSNWRDFSVFGCFEVRSLT
jgi:predicted nucleic acid-binding protein